MNNYGLSWSRTFMSFCGRYIMKVRIYNSNHISNKTIRSNFYSLTCNDRDIVTSHSSCPNTNQSIFSRACNKIVP